MKLSDFGIHVQSGYGNVRTTCPKCSGNRSKSHERCLSVDTKEGKWLCHHCGWAGDLSKMDEKKDRNDVYKPPVIPKHEHVELPDDLLQALLKRGISREVLAENKICLGSYWDAKKKQKIPAIKFPYFKGGVVVNAKHKTLDKQFRQEAGAEACMYRFDVIASSESEYMVLCEGELDALSCAEAGLFCATSVPNGAPSVNTQNYEREFNYLESAQNIFERFKKIILAVDADGPGKKLEQELARRIGIEKCYRVAWPKGCKDANDVLVKYGKSTLKQTVLSATPYPVAGIYCADDVRDLVCHLYEVGEQRGLGTGWPFFDRHYTVKAGQLTIVTGIPSHGKSNFVDSLAVNLCKTYGWRFAVFSPENWPIERHIQTLVEKLAEKSFHGKLRLRPEELEVWMGVVNERFSFLMPEEDDMTIDSILEKARVCIFRHGVRGLILDPWNEVDHAYRNETETQYISRNLGKIRRFARRNGVHIWVVAHPQKLIKDKDTGKYNPPTMYEISGGAHWRNKADMGLCVHRPDLSRDETVVYIQKVRFRECGDVGAVRFAYCRETGIYTDLRSEGLTHNVDDGGK